MSDRELLALAGIVDDLITLMPVDGAAKRDLGDRLLKLRETLLADWRARLEADHPRQCRGYSAADLQNAVTMGNA